MMHHLAKVTCLNLTFKLFGYKLLVDYHVASCKLVIVILLSNFKTSHLVYLSAGPYCEPSDRDTPQVY